MNSEQLRAARGMLRIDQSTLAELAGVSAQTIKRLEKMDGLLEGNASTIRKIQNALEQAGTVFIDAGTSSESGGVGVRLKT